MNKVLKPLFITALLVSVAFLSFLTGAIIVKFKTWPYPLLWDVFMVTKAIYVQNMPGERFGGYFYQWTPNTKSGVFQYDKDKAYNGLTLFTSGHAQKAFLVDMDGKIKHEWSLPFSQVWPEDPPHIQGSPVPDYVISWRKAHLYPNGDLLAVYTCVGDTPWGYGLVKMDKDSKIIWKYAGRVHHDVEIDQDGKIYTLAHEFKTTPIKGVKVAPPLIEDYIVVLSPTGQELKKLAVSQIFRDSKFANILKRPIANLRGDLWHTNSVEPLTTQMADKFPFLKAGQVLFSVREVDSIAVVDLEQEKVVWVTRGPWLQQHDPDFLPNGNMLVFDNLGNYGNKTGSSRIIEVNPNTLEVVWQYGGNSESPFTSYGMGAQQELPNRNILITSSYQGRIFEVNRDKEIVWEFLSPFRAEHDKNLVGIVRWAQRFHPDSLNFEFSN